MTMTMRRLSLIRILGFALIATFASEEAFADAVAETGQIETVVVTAQKRVQSVNDVGMTITAATGEELHNRGITSVKDLVRLVPGLTIQDGAFNSTSFSLRGVGFFNSDLDTPPAVSIYMDEAPLPYPAMTKLTAFDLERVEVLKGPQGTLYGQNATGGAINYIAAKPTDEFKAGLDLSYERFNRITAEGYLSGPLTDDLNARVAVRGEYGDGWQVSTTRPGDTLGRIRDFQGRATLDWRPTDRLTSALTFTFTHDGSDSQASQFVAAVPVIPALAAPGLLTFPVVETPRAADWTPVVQGTNTPFPYASNTNLFHVAWRNDYQLTDDVTLTSLTSFASFRMKYGQDTDGTPFHLNEVIDRGGRIDTFFQELRLSGKAESLNWLLGANYDHDLVSDSQLDFFIDKDVCHLFLSSNPGAFCDTGTLKGRTKVNTYGVFAHLEYDLTDTLSAEGGVRYDNDSRTFDTCAYANTAYMGAFFDIFESLANGGAPVTPVPAGHCYVLDPANNFRPVDNIHRVLSFSSAPWRFGLNWKVQPDILLYANVSKGYKAGLVPVVGAATTTQFTPVRPESLLAYEAGIKATLFDQHVQINAAGFYYDYKNKQLRGSLLDAAFGPLEAMVSIPKSHVVGAEVQLIAHPLDGLVIDTSATYVHTQIDQFIGYDAFANLGNQAGTPFPFSPEWSSVTDINYERPVTDDLNGFIGGTVTYNGNTYSGIGALAPLKIDSFALLDLRGGVETPDGRYRLSIWGKNVTDTYYWNSVFVYGNSISRYVGAPATYGLTFSIRF